MEKYLSDVEKVTIGKFRMARYVMITPNPEEDVNTYMQNWAKNSGLLDYEGYSPRLIGWDFPFVSEEQQKKFGLRGYVSAYIIPEEFEPACQGTEIAYQKAGNYAKIAITDPFADPFKRIPGGYQEIFSYLKDKRMQVSKDPDRTCFEEVYETEGVCYMDVYMPMEE